MQGQRSVWPSRFELIIFLFVSLFSLGPNSSGCLIFLVIPNFLYLSAISSSQQRLYHRKSPLDDYSSIINLFDHLFFIFLKGPDIRTNSKRLVQICSSILICWLFFLFASQKLYSHAYIFLLHLLNHLPINLVDLFISASDIITFLFFFNFFESLRPKLLRACWILGHGFLIDWQVPYRNVITLPGPVIKDPAQTLVHHLECFLFGDYITIFVIRCCVEKPTVILGAIIVHMLPSVDIA